MRRGVYLWGLVIVLRLRDRAAGAVYCALCRAAVRMFYVQFAIMSDNATIANTERAR